MEPSPDGQGPPEAPIPSSDGLVTTPGQDDNKYFIYASTAEKSTTASVQVLEAGSSSDKFVSFLNQDQVIILSGSPNPTAEFDKTDTTAAWLALLDSNATASITVDSSTAAKPISSFSIQFKAPWTLVFSSATDVLLATFGAASDLIGNGSGARIPPPGLSADGAMLTCGLDFTQTPQVENCKIEDLFKFAGLAPLAETLPKAIMAMEANLDKTPDINKPRQRNALWLSPKSDMHTTIRLQFQVGVIDELDRLLSSALKGLKLENAIAVCNRTSVLGQTINGPKAVEKGSFVFSVQASVQAVIPDAPKVEFEPAIEFFETSILLTVLFQSRDTLTGILKWLAWLIDEQGTLDNLVQGLLEKEESGSRVFPDFYLKRAIIRLDTSKSQANPILDMFSFDIEVSTSFGRGSDTTSPAIFLISYTWSREIGGLGTLSGQLWNDYDTTPNEDLQPEYEAWLDLKPFTQSARKSIDLASIIPTKTILNIPDTLPSQITRAYVQVSQNSFAVGGTITAKKITPGSAPQPYLGEVALDASFEWGKSDVFKLSLGVAAGIQPSTTSSIQIPAILSGNLNYDSTSKTWDFKASLTGLYASTLVDFFDSSSQDHVMPLIKSIAINTLNVEYKYTPVTESGSAGVQGTSQGTSFDIQGDLLIGDLTVGLVFKHDNSGWSFSGKVNPENKQATIGDVLDGIIGDGDEMNLPDFLANMRLVADNENVFTLDMFKKSTTQDQTTSDSFQFLAQLKIGDLGVVFAQLHGTGADWVPGAQSKRLVKVAITGFPALHVDIPLVGDIQQPLDELYYLWIQDPDPAPSASVEGQGNAPANRVAGLSRKDVAQLNDSLTDKLIVKDHFKEPKKDSDLLIGTGSHFSVIIKDPTTGERSSLLDYDFMKPAQSKPERALTPAGTMSMARETDDNGSSSESSQAPFKKKQGPLSFSNVGLKYKSKTLSIMFDATFDLGPLGFSLLGFSINAEFETLDVLPHLSASIQGLSAVFDRPPLTIAGTIRHGNTGGIDYYAGGMILQFVPYQFRAAGFYGMVTSTDPKKPFDPFKSVFIFAKLEGPLITLEFAEISGFCGGFGYNSNVRFPTAAEVTQFPFVDNSTLGGADDVLQVLQKLTDPSPAGWFQPLDNSYWMAAGMKIDAFQMLSIDAVVLVQFGSSVKLGLLAVATADIPTATSPEKFAHVELGIAVTVDLDYGVMKAEVQLSPRSYIMHPDCHLTGGAALYYWFDGPRADAANVGNFVFTLGGYHAAYKVPTAYPTPPRLGISWTIGKVLSISGEAYFAITPQVCMGGGRLHASFSAGPIQAWFDAFADFLINYKPFHFQAQGGISVGVRVNIDFLFIHTHVSVEIGAQLYLWGPPLAGRVHVDLWITSFNINFGAAARPVPAIALVDFYLLVLQASSSPQRQRQLEAARPAAVEGSQVNRPKNEGHVFLASSGLMNPGGDSGDSGQNAPWTVRAGTFAFTISCKMAINSAKVNDTMVTPSTGNEIFSRPLHLTSTMSSTLVITITQDGVAAPEVGWRLDEEIKSLPRGLWAKYDASLDPSSGNNNVKDLLSGQDGTMSLMTGIQVMAPPAIMSPDPLPAFEESDADLEDIPAKRPFPTQDPSNDSWEPVPPFTGEDVRRQYDLVNGSWGQPGWGVGDGGQSGFVKGWADAFGWDSAALSSIARIPARIQKHFSDLYVAAPLLTR